MPTRPKSKINGTIYLYSTGGCGTRTLYKWLKEKYSNINGAADVHYGQPPANIGPNDKIIHLFGNPIPIISSFFFRHRDNGRFIIEHSGNLRIPTPMLNVKGFVNSKQDQFKLQQHFNKHKKRPNSILINYHKMWDNLPEILEYLGLSHEIDNFPPQTQRRSRNFFNDEQLEILNETYKPLIDEIEKIDIKIQ